MTQTNNAIRKKEGRGLFLTIFLVIHSINATLLSAFFIFELYNLRTLANFFLFLTRDGVEVFIIDLAISFLSAVTVIALWKWSKIGAYLLIILLGVWVLNYFTYWLPVTLKNARVDHISPILPVLQDVGIYLLFSFLYLWAIKRKWHLFS